MPRSTTLLHIPQPCAQSWDAMTSSGPGRHCAACQKVVVDFSQKTDAEILAYLARASGEVCGRLGTDQLHRALRPAVPASPARRWSAWLALLLAAANLRPGAAGAATAPVHRGAQPTKKASPRRRPTHSASRRLRGVVRDAATQAPILGVAVFLKGENRSAVTDSAGRFSLRLPAGRARSRHTLVAHFFGYHSATVVVPAAAGARPVHIALPADPAATQAVVIGYGTQERRIIMSGAISTIDARSFDKSATEPKAGLPRSFWRWLTQPFRHRATEETAN